MTLTTATGVRRLADDLCELGLGAGETVLVHCSLRALGRPAGGPRTLLNAIRSVIGVHGTIVVPTETPNNSTTSRVYRHATTGMTEAERALYEMTIPAFDPATTPSHGMGSFAEWVRYRPGALRSSHPQTSFAAFGPRAAEVVARHDLSCHLGDESPIGALYAAGARVLLLGVGFDSCTVLHLAEYRLPWPPRKKRYACFVAQAGGRVRREFIGADLDDSRFADIGLDLDDQPFVRAGRVGGGIGRLLPVREAVDFAVSWFSIRGHQRVTAV